MKPLRPDLENKETAGRVSAAGAGGTLVTLTVGVVIDHFGYNAAFWFPALLPGLALASLVILMRDRRPRRLLNDQRNNS